jgi:hypothetical protein
MDRIWIVLRLPVCLSCRVPTMRAQYCSRWVAPNDSLLWYIYSFKINGVFKKLSIDLVFHYASRGYITLSATVAPSTAPTMGPNMYTHAPWKATDFQPAHHATKRGPKSRAGLNPACVNGAKTAMRAPTVKPISGGMKESLIPSFFSFVSEKMTNDSMAVPIVSARNAIPVDIGGLHAQQQEDVCQCSPTN